jgi:hypothetical protein
VCASVDPGTSTEKTQGSSSLKDEVTTSSLEILDIISATPLAAMDLETTHQAAISEAAGNSARSSDTESAIPETLGGSWDPCNLDEEILSSLEQEGLIAAKEISRWRVDPGAAASAPSKKGDCDAKISH